MSKEIFNFRLEKHLIERFRLFAELDGLNYSEVMRRLISDYCDSSYQKHQKDIDDLRKK